MIQLAPLFLLAPIGTLPAPLSACATALQLPSPGGTPQEAQAERKERARRRVVVLHGGGVLRGLARPTAADGWEVKGKGGWRAVPASAIASVELERDVLKELEQREEDGALPPADLVQWTFSAGLLKEGFQLGDAMLADHPRDADLRSVCASAGRYVAGFPERGASDELDRLRDLGARGSAVVREAVVERLVTAAPRDELLRAVRQDMRSKQSNRRAFAMQAQGRHFPGEDPRGLLLHAVWDPSEAARAEAARAVAEIGSAEVGAPLVRALSSETPELRLRAAEALGSTRDDLFVPALMDRLYTLAAIPQSGGGFRPPHAYIFVGTQTAYVQDFDVEVAQFAAIADPVVNTLLEGAVLDVGVIGVTRVTVRQERRVIIRALRDITGEDVGSSSKDWAKWWESDASSRYRTEPGVSDGAPVDR
ncbi:MAG: HEAT repeat domain-containing protein [Planctomycetota bacterium]